MTEDPPKMTFNDLCTNLILISKITPGEKLFIKNGTIPTTVKPHDYISWVRRSWLFLNEKRDDGLSFIKETINQSISYIDNTSSCDVPNTTSKKNSAVSTTNHNNTNVNINQLYINLKAAVGGIENLKFSYNTDTGMKASLDTCIQTINLFLGEKKDPYIPIK